METGVHGLPYRQVDVFAEGPTGGNGLAVFWDCPELSTTTMQLLTVEMRQFESAFVAKTPHARHFRIRVFTMEEELAFAGHPLIGAAAVLHEKHGAQRKEHWILQTNTARVAVETMPVEGGFLVTMNQPAPVFVGNVEKPAVEIARWIGLSADDLDLGLPLEVVSTGLPYLIIPVRSSLSVARVAVEALEKRLHELGASFLYVYDTARSEGRTWDNRGLVEDIATGSAAGPVAAYLCKHGRLAPGHELTIRQGRFVGRPSVMKARVIGTRDSYQGVQVSGRVNLVASGVFD